jgi:hypothetical protein
VPTFYRPSVVHVSDDGGGHAALIALAAVVLGAASIAPLLVHLFWVSVAIAATALGTAIVGGLGYLAYKLARPEVTPTPRAELDAAVAAMYATPTRRPLAQPAPVRLVLVRDAEGWGTLTPESQVTGSTDLHRRPVSATGRAAVAARRRALGGDPR